MLSDRPMETGNNRAQEAGLYGGRTSSMPGEEGPTQDRMAWFLQRTKYINSAASSTNMVELYRQWEKNYRMFNSVHPPGSKYFSKDWQQRSKLFRPKIRTAIRKNESRAAAAFFSTRDVVSVDADDDSDEVQRASAEFWNEMMNIRLTRSVPWFLICIGAYQTADVVGAVVSKVAWEYEAKITGTDENGAQIAETLIDRPRIDLVPPENVRIDRACDWTRPMESTPYIQVWTGMYAGDVRAKTKSVDVLTGRPKWLAVGEHQLRAAARTEGEALRTAREGQSRSDPTERATSVPDHEMVWVVENIDRIDGDDWVWLTLGDHAMLSEPKPLKEVYRQGRPYRMGSSMVEAFKVFPTGKPELAEGLSQATNEIANSRVDNVRWAMHGRTIVRRGKGIDLHQVANSGPGKIILVNAIEDIEFDRPPDVTQSSYQEQQYLNADIDDILGSFTAGSVQTNRVMGETVGGMNLMASSASQIGDLDLRTFAETFVEPTLRLFLKVLQLYETNVSFMVKAANRAKLIQKYGINEITDQILDAELTMSVDVGIGATDPNMRLQRFATATKMAAETFAAAAASPLVAKTWNIKEQIKEIYGHAGYKDGLRFFNFEEDQDPRITMFEQQLEQAMNKIKELEGKADVQLRIADTRRQSAFEVQTLRNQGALEKTEFEAVTDMALAHFNAAHQATENRRQGNMKLIEGMIRQ